MQKILTVGTRSGPGDRWAVFLHFERDGVPNVALLSSVSSYSEAEQRQRDNGCDVLLVPAEVMQEMIDSGVGPQIG